MTLILSALLFSLSANLDNLVIGIAYGIKQIRIGMLANLLIALITTTGTFLSMTVGGGIANFLPTSISNAIGAIIIILLGVYFSIQSIITIRTNKKSKELALKNVNSMVDYAQNSDLDCSGDINLKEALFVSFGLTFNNLGTGIAASITGVSISVTVICTFILSIIIIVLGEVLGNNILGKLLGKYAPLISGLLLIIFGIVEILN